MAFSTGSLWEEAMNELDWSVSLLTGAELTTTDPQTTSTLSSVHYQPSSSFLLQPSQPLPTQTPALPYKAPNSISATGAQPYVSSAQEDAAASGSTPSSTTSSLVSTASNSAASSSGKVHLGPKVIAGIAGGGALLIGIIGILIWLLMRSRRPRTRRCHSSPSSQGALFEVDETLVVTPLTDMTRPTTASSSFSSSPSSTAPSMHQIPNGLSGIGNNLPGTLGSSETLSKEPPPRQPCDIYISDVDAGPAQFTPHVHIMPPQYDPQWTTHTTAHVGDGKA